MAFPLEVRAIKLGALLLTEILGSLRTVLSGTMGGGGEVIATIKQKHLQVKNKVRHPVNRDSLTIIY